MRGGELQAAGRQGVDELGQALKALPESIQAHAEPGGMFEPLHYDIAAARDQHALRSDLPSPGDIAKGRNFTAAERGEGTIHGQTQTTAHGHPQGSVHGKGTQYAQLDVFMSEDVPMPGPSPEAAPMPEPAPAGEGNATQGQAPRPGTWAARELERRANNEGGNDQNALGRGRSLADEQRARERDDRDRGR